MGILVTAVSKKEVNLSIVSLIFPLSLVYSSYQSEITAESKAWEIFESGFSIINEIKMSSSGSRKP